MLKKCKLIEPVSVNENDSSVAVAKKIKETMLRQIFVVDGSDKPVGIVSITDINNRIVAAGKNPNDLKARDIMTKDIVVADEDNDNMFEVYKKMVAKNVVSCPVARKGKFLGILTVQEALECMTNLKELEEHKQ